MLPYSSVRVSSLFHSLPSSLFFLIWHYFLSCFLHSNTVGTFVHDIWCNFLSLKCVLLPVIDYVRSTFDFISFLCLCEAIMSLFRKWFETFFQGATLELIFYVAGSLIVQKNDDNGKTMLVAWDNILSTHGIVNIGKVANPGELFYVNYMLLTLLPLRCFRCPPILMSAAHVV